jgi:hypothetical protein
MRCRHLSRRGFFNERSRRSPEIRINEMSLPLAQGILKRMEPPCSGENRINKVSPSIAQGIFKTNGATVLLIESNK